jgi:hypothetical protein
MHFATCVRTWCVARLYSVQCTVRWDSSISETVRNRTYVQIVTCYTMQKSCFHRAVAKRAEEIRREPTKAEESRSEPSQQKGGMFILRCSATVGYTRYAFSITIATVFGGVRSVELSWKPSAIQSQFVRSSPTSQLLSSSLKKWIRGVSSRREFQSVKMQSLW